MTRTFVVLILACCLLFSANGARPAECELPAVVGPCRAAITRFYFKPSSNKCESFIYGGCDGNDNRFESEQSCMDRCANP